MGNQLLSSELKGDGNSYAVATRDDERLYVMVVNVSRDTPVEIDLNVPGIEFNTEGRMATLSHREYFWDIYKHEPKWSRKPGEKPFTFTGKLDVPPYSACVFELPLKGFELRPETAVENAEIRPLEILLPDAASADLPIEGWIFLQNDPEDANVEERFDHAIISVEGPATADVEQIRLREAAGRFYLTPKGPGTVIVTAKSNTISVERTLEILPVQERREIIWQFEDAVENWNAETSYQLIGDDSVRPNQQVAAVVLDGDLPTSGNDKLMMLTPPESVDKKRISGVVLDVGVSRDFQCSDKNIGIRFVLQSEMDHWIELGSLTLEKVRGSWKTVELKLPDSKYYPAMGSTYALFIQLYQNADSKVPVSGRIYIDNAGFILR